MKNTLLPALLAVAVPAFAQESIQTIAPDALETSSSNAFEFSARIGMIGERSSSDGEKYNNWFDNGAAIQFEARAAIADTGLDIVARGYFGSCGVKDDEAGFVSAAIPNYRRSGYDVYEVVLIDDGDVNIFGGSLQAQYNFARGSMINPYVAVGVAYEKSSFEIDASDYVAIAQRGTANILYAEKIAEEKGRKFDEDGTAFVGRVGAEFDVAPFWFVVEASYLSTLYDWEDDGQFEISGRAGWQFTERCRIDAGVDYYTGWEQVFLGVGATFSI